MINRILEWLNVIETINVIFLIWILASTFLGILFMQFLFLIDAPKWILPAGFFSGFPITTIVFITKYKKIHYAASRFVKW